LNEKLAMTKINMGSLFSFFLFIFFALGVVTTRFFSSFFTFLTLSFITAFLVYFLYKRNKTFLSDIFILLVFFFLGFLWQVSDSGEKIEALLNQERQVTLKVVSLPKSLNLRSSFTAQIEDIDGSRLDAKVKAFDYTKSMRYLSRYQLLGKLTRRKYHNRWFYYLWVKSKAPLKEIPLGFWDGLAKRSSGYILNVFKKNSTDRAYRFLAAIFLGRRELLVEEREFFAKAGVSHLLAISGLHIGITSVILFFFLGFFGISFRLRLAISLIFLYLYTFLTGASPSTLRAAIMYSVFAFSFFLKTRAHPLNSLGLAGLVCLLIDPRMLFSIGFQLSFVAVFAIIIGHRLLLLKISGNRILVYIKEIFFCSLLVTIFIVPLVSYYFGHIHLLGIVYNIILIPFFTLILTLNFLLLIFSPIALIAQNLGVLLSILIHGFVALVQFLSSLRFSYLECQFSPKTVFGYYLILTVIFILFKLKRLKA